MKKFLSILLAVTMLLSMVCMASANDGSGKKDVGEHEHELMDMANAACHYSECTICFELFNVGDHTFENGKCTVCGHSQQINPFSDVPETAWYHNDVVAAVSLGLINGKTPTLFAPNDNLTYAEAIKLAACMNQYSKEGKVTLKNGNPWYQTYVDYCIENKIITKMYNYNEKATRAGYIEIFANALTDDALKAINKISDGMIPDVPMSASYAKSVYKMYRAGILQGVDLQYNCNPNANIKRGEVATILVRMMEPARRVEFTIDGGSISEGEVKVPVKEDNTVVEILPTVDYDVEINTPVVIPDLEIIKHPEGSDEEAYGTTFELSVQVFGGKAPYTYEWQYNGYRNQKTVIENGDYAKDATTEALILFVEKGNPLLGNAISCKVTDSAGETVTSNAVKVYGPFSMPVEQSLNENGENILTGTVADGILKKGEKVSVIRNGKVVAIGTAEDFRMFGKSLDETAKGDNVGIVFAREDGVRPSNGDIVVRYQPDHVIDTSDIIN